MWAGWLPQNAGERETNPGTWHVGIDLGTGGLKVGAVGPETVGPGKRLALDRDRDHRRRRRQEQYPFAWFEALESF